MLNNLKLAFGGVVFATLAACGGGGGGTAPVAETDTLRLALTDAPACGYDSVNITVEKNAFTRVAAQVTQTQVGLKFCLIRPGASTS